MTLYLIAMVYYIVYLSLFLYLAYCSFNSKQIFLSRYLYGWLFMSFFIFNPLNLHGIFSERSLVSLIIFIALSILFIVFFITKGHEDNYQFINAIKDPKIIAEHALRNLNISYESLEDSTRIIDYEDTALLYIKPKNECISFKVQDKALQNQTIQEIREIMDTYKKPRKIRALFHIFMILIASAARFVTLASM